MTTVFNQIRDAQRNRVLSAFGVKTIQPEAVEEDVQKGDTEFEPYNVYEGDEVEKADILNAVSNCDNPITMKKSGKEIKEQIQSVVLPEKRASLQEKKKEAEELLEECGNAPTHGIPPYYTGNIKTEDIPFRIYEWNETYYREDKPTVMSSLSVYDQEDKEIKLKINAPANAEQGAAREKYNQEVYKYCEILTDIKCCEILLKNLKDTDNLELTARQILAFQFD